MKFFLAAALIVIPLYVFAVDGGASIDNALLCTSDSVRNEVIVTPWFRAALGHGALFYASCDVVNKNSNEGWRIIPRISISGFYFKPNPILDINAGRLAFCDSSGIIAKGIFDGLYAELRAAPACFSFAAFYTGLLEKNQTKIIMTEQDRADFNDDDNYYAPKKAFASFECILRDIFGYRNEISTGVIAQFDIAKNAAFDNQYVTLRTQFSLLEVIALRFCSAMGIAVQDSEKKLRNASFIALDLMPATAPAHHTFTARLMWSSGQDGTGLEEFSPVTIIEQGDVFEAPLGNLAFFDVQYNIVYQTLVKFNAAFKWFFRTSDAIPLIQRVDTGAERSLGQEIYLNTTFAPLSDMMMNAGFGVFIPADVYHDEIGKIIWKCKFTIKINL